jgi:acyl-homoserine-lactone acylase
MRRIITGLFAFAAALSAATPQKGTEILWDSYGVAHVYAKSTEDLFYCYGYAQAQSHGDLLLHLYGESRGRAAEYFDASYLEDDKWVWTNSVPQRSAQWLKMQTPTFRSYMEAFAKGINDYAAKHPEALSAESKRVLPVTALDPIEHTHRIVHYTYLAPRRLASVGVAPVSEASLLQTPEDVGSNGWAIAPAHTAAGRTLLLGNPHLAWGGWQTYYEIQLTAPGIDLYGASQVGFPVLRFMFSEYLGFNQTVNSIDAVDLYKITPRDNGYVFDGATKPFGKSQYTVKVRQADGSFQTQTFDVLSTVHGPVIRGQPGREMVAMRVAALDRPFMLQEYWDMATAHDFRGFEKAVARLQVPCFNILYGDRDGHIEYLYNGTAPRRRSGDLRYWAGVVPGDTSDTLWTDYLTYEELPKSVDPPSGYVHNTNDPPWNASWPNSLDPDKYPPYLAPRTSTFRAERSLRMLYEDPKITYDKFLLYKHSTRAEMADRILPDLFKAVDESGTPLARQAAEVLKAWDRQAEASSRGAVLFYEWAVQFMGASLGSQAGFAVPYDVKLPLTTPRGLKDPAKAAQQLDAAAAKVLKEHGALDVPWGDVMRFQFAGLDLPGNGGFGNLGIFRVITFGSVHGATRSQTHGETWISAVEFGRLPKAPIANARVLMTYGNSSQPGSKHQSDQLPLLEKKQLRTAWRTRAAVMANLESRDRF